MSTHQIMCSSEKSDPQSPNVSEQWAMMGSLSFDINFIQLLPEGSNVWGGLMNNVRLGVSWCNDHAGLGTSRQRR